MPPGLVLPKARDRAQVDQAEDAGAQRKGGTRPQDRPGEVLQGAFLLLPRGPEEAGGGEVDEALQFDAQDGAWADTPGPGRACQIVGAGEYYGRDLRRKLIKCLKSSDS